MLFPKNQWKKNHPPNRHSRNSGMAVRRVVYYRLSSEKSVDKGCMEEPQENCVQRIEDVGKCLGKTEKSGHGDSTEQNRREGENFIAAGDAEKGIAAAQLVSPGNQVG